MRLEGFENYGKPMIPGVRLPVIEIDESHYERLGLDPTVSVSVFLEALCMDGLKAKGLDKLPNSAEYLARLKMELGVFDELGFTDYILLNWDIMNYAHENNIPTGYGRGSAAGSLVLYLVNVTNVDPIKHGLFFERFVSKSRAKKTIVDGITYLDGSLMPDVDNDVEYLQRQDVIAYVNRKYPGKTSKILTINTLTGKLCIKECLKIVEEASEEDANHASDLVDKLHGKVYELHKAYGLSEEFKDFCDEHPKVYKIALKLESLNKNFGVHPSGVAISHDDIRNVMPLQKTGDGELTSAYTMDDVSAVTVKFDILGLRTLTIVADTARMLGVDFKSIDFDVPSTYGFFQDLRNANGIFQIEARTNFQVCQSVRPRDLHELSCVIAIARPGALPFTDAYAKYIKTGEFQSTHPFFDDILSTTGGIPIFQEQLMKMIVKIGFTADEAETIRRIVGKKKVDEMPVWKERIEKKVAENNLDPRIAEVVWSVAEDSAHYSFNASHAISYAKLSALTTYLKFNHPKEFFTAVLKGTQSRPDPMDAIEAVSQELPFFGIKLLPPDLVKSDSDFSVEGDDIRYGLNAIKGVSSKVIDALLEFRKAKLTTRVDAFLAAKEAGLSISTLSTLIQAGTLMSLSPNRCRMVLEAQTFNKLTPREKRNVAIHAEKFGGDVLNAIHDFIKTDATVDDGKKFMSAKRQKTFKASYAQYKAIYEQNSKFSKFANWFFERRVLGYSYSYKLKDVFRENADERLYTTYEVSQLEDRTSVKVVGIVKDAFKKVSKNGNKYMQVNLSDEFGVMTCRMMDNRRRQNLTAYFEAGGEVPEEESIVIVFGQKSGDSMFIERLTILDEKIYTKLSELKDEDVKV